MLIDHVIKVVGKHGRYRDPGAITGHNYHVGSGTSEGSCQSVLDRKGLGCVFPIEKISAGNRLPLEVPVTSVPLCNLCTVRNMLRKVSLSFSKP